MPDSDPNVLQIDPSDRRDKRVLLINMIGSAIIGAVRADYFAAGAAGGAV